LYSVDDHVWREDVLWETWRQGKATYGAPGVDGTAIEEMVATGQEEAMSEPWQTALRTHRSQVVPVRVVESPKPKGGTRPLGIATVEDRVVQTAMKLVLEPLVEADFHACSYGYRPKRDAKLASMAIREDLYHRAWGGRGHGLPVVLHQPSARQADEADHQADGRWQDAEVAEADAPGREVGQGTGCTDNDWGASRGTALAVVQP
jgi:hypothetical protein